MTNRDMNDIDFLALCVNAGEGSVKETKKGQDQCFKMLKCP